MIKAFAISCVLLLVLGTSVPALQGIIGCPFDTFGEINCESEMARLDNFAVSLLSAPNSRGAIVFYSGQTSRGRLPRRGEGAARAARIIHYLVNRRGVPADKLVLIDGGYGTEWQATLWMVPPGAGLPIPERRIPIDQIKFRKGKVRPSDFRCRI